MKLISIIISKCSQKNERPVLLVLACDTKSISFNLKTTIKDISKFLTRELVPRVPISTREVIKHEGHLFYIVRYGNGLAITLLTDEDYPQRIAFKCADDVFNDILPQLPQNVLNTLVKDNMLSDYSAKLKSILKDYEDPKTFDAVTIVNEKVERNKQVVQKQLGDILNNIEELNTLIEQSNDLSFMSQQMFKRTKKLKKSCCKII